MAAARLSKTVVGIRDGKQISYDAFSGLRLQVPSVKEQKRISDFLNLLQEKIELLIKELTQTQQFKKGLLQQMFV
jgi:type I restriction enzyme S subunit